MKSVVICADDFGYSQKINDAIVKSVKNGLVSSVSALLDGPIAKDAAKLQQIHKFEVGLHLNLENRSKTDWKVFFEDQYDKFVSLYGQKPSSVSIHASKYLQKNIPKSEFPLIYMYLKVFCLENQLYLRGSDSEVITYKASKSLDVTKKKFKQLIKAANKSTKNLVEIVVHPGESNDYDLNSSYPDFLRKNELSVLTDSGVIHYTEGQVRVVSYRDV